MFGDIKMMNLNDVPTAWDNFKQIETGVKKYPTILRFRVFGTTYYGAIDEKGKLWVRYAPISIKGLTGCSAAKIKELQR